MDKKDNAAVKFVTALGAGVFSIWGSSIGAAIAAGVVVAVAWLSHRNVADLIVLGILAMAGTLVLFNQYAHFRHTLARRDIVHHLSLHVDKWLKRYGFQVGIMTSEKYQDAIFAFNGIRGNQKIEVRQWKKAEPYLEIAAGIVLEFADPKNVLGAGQMDLVKEAVVREIQIELARVGATPSVSNNQFIMVERVLIDESLNEYTFIEKLESILSAMTLCQMIWIKSSSAALTAMMHASNSGKAAPPTQAISGGCP